jgi:hypothetical protein
MDYRNIVKQKSIWKSGNTKEFCPNINSRLSKINLQTESIPYIAADQ